MRRLLTLVLSTVAVAAVPSAANAQGAFLSPPENHYFKSENSWGQKYADQWGLARVGFDNSPQSAWRLVKADAAPVVVAVIDTGLDWNHKNIDWANIWRNPKETAGNGIDDDKNGYIDDVVGWDFVDRDNKPWDYDGHGTFVAGIIAGSWKDSSGIAGINPFARLMVLKALNNFGHTRASYLAEAITYATDNGARIINLSAGGKDLTKAELQAIEYAYSKGVLIVAAAGNDGVDVGSFGIASSDKVLTVAASDFEDKRPGFSNWGKIAVAAPGVDILSLRARRTDAMLSIQSAKYVAGSNYVGNDKRHYRASGTSFSAPHVTGLASLMLANDPSLSNVQLMRIIKSTARDVGVPGVDQFTGYGIIDARAALSAPKDFMLFAGIDKVEAVKKGNDTVVRVLGTADANAFKGARLEIGAGETPTKWTRTGAAQKTAGPGGILGEIPVSALKGSAIWQIRVVVQHNNGAEREAHFRLALN